MRNDNSNRGNFSTNAPYQSTRKPSKRPATDRVEKDSTDQLRPKLIKRTPGPKITFVNPTHSGNQEKSDKSTNPTDRELFEKFQQFMKVESASTDVQNDSFTNRAPKETSTPLNDHNVRTVIRQVEVECKRCASVPPGAMKSTQTPQRKKSKCELANTHVFQSFAKFSNYISSLGVTRRCNELADLRTFMEQV